MLSPFPDVVTRLDPPLVAAYTYPALRQEMVPSRDVLRGGVFL